MPTTLRIKPPAEKDIRDLPPTMRQRIIDALSGLKAIPLPQGVQKLKGLERSYRLRVGDYRVLYEFEAATEAVTIYRVKHRRDVYR